MSFDQYGSLPPSASPAWQGRGVGNIIALSTHRKHITRSPRRQRRSAAREPRDRALSPPTRMQLLQAPEAADGGRAT